MSDFLSQNFFFFLPLLAFSVTSLAVALEKTLMILNQKDLSDKNFSRALSFMEKGDWAQVRSYFSGLKGPVTQLFQYCDSLDAGVMEDPTMKLSSLAQQILDSWKNRLDIFSHIANLATLTGLFGTVTGMIWSFSAIQAAGSADPATVAGGISQALVTTFAGLAVALPSLLFHGFFTSKVNRKADQMEVLSAEFLSYYFHKQSLDRENVNP